jgi:hypothetical protein
MATDRISKVTEYKRAGSCYKEREIIPRIKKVQLIEQLINFMLKIFEKKKGIIIQALKFNLKYRHAL